MWESVNFWPMTLGDSLISCVSNVGCTYTDVTRYCVFTRLITGTYMLRQHKLDSTNIQWLLHARFAAWNMRTLYVIDPTRISTDLTSMCIGSPFTLTRIIWCPTKLLHERKQRPSNGKFTAIYLINIFVHTRMNKILLHLTGDRLHLTGGIQI
jgi:hypothetical protein